MTDTAQVQVPKTSKTAVISEGGKLVVKDVPTQVVGENEVLIKVAVVGLNPTDWKSARLRTTPGNYAGCDFAGEIVKVGPNPKVNFKIGDKVSASVSGNTSNQRGAFSQYAKAFTDLTWKIPDGTFSYEEAVTTGVPLNTAFQSLYGPKTLRLIQPGAATPPEASTWVFIHGGSSSVGQYAVQLAKLSGYKVVTLASPRNHALLTSLGADLVFDYRDPQVVEKIKKGTGDKIHVAVDTISEPDTQVTTVRVLAESKPGKVIVILPVIEGARNFRKDVEIIATFVPSAYGVDSFYGKADDEEREALSEFLQNIVPSLIKAGKLKPNAMKLWDGGLEKIDEGLTYLQSGKASAEKIVFKL